MHISVVAALHAEAGPLIAHFGLKQNTHSRTIPVYGNDTMTLAVSGVGKLKAAIATTYLLAQTPSPDETAAINIGIAGSTQDADAGPINIGDLFVIHKIVDHATGRESYPDILVGAGTAEAAVTTVDAPLDRTDAQPVADGLVDMEAAGFYQAAATFLPPHRIGCVKIVSDFLEVRRFKKTWISGLIERRLDRLEPIIQRYGTFADLRFDALQDEDYAVLDDIRRSLQLTVSQYRFLTDWATAHKLRTQGPLPDLTTHTQTVVTGKSEGKQHLERLRIILMDE